VQTGIELFFALNKRKSRKMRKQVDLKNARLQFAQIASYTATTGAVRAANEFTPRIIALARRQSTAAYAH